MNKYELLCIMASNTPEETITATIEKLSGVVTTSGGEVEKVDKWGVKRLAYPINFKNDGFYFLMTFTARGDLIAEMDRQMRITDGIYRQMFTRVA